LLVTGLTTSLFTLAESTADADRRVPPDAYVLVAMTGYGRETDRQRSQKAGFDHHLVKPADFEKVRQILATVSETAS
jgi:CheY-like chemotaxis protein